MIEIRIIDADTAVRYSARQILERAGFAVTEAARAETAGAEAKAGPCPHLVIADPAIVSLPAIRRLHPAAKILAIGPGGNAGPGKPFTPSRLLVAVRLALARPAATTARRRRSPRPPRRPA